jgi:hypothetical protein
VAERLAAFRQWSQGAGSPSAEWVITRREAALVFAAFWAAERDLAEARVQLAEVQTDLSRVTDELAARVQERDDQDATGEGMEELLAQAEEQVRLFKARLLRCEELLAGQLVGIHPKSCGCPACTYFREKRAAMGVTDEDEPVEALLEAGRALAGDEVTDRARKFLFGG